MQVMPVASIMPAQTESLILPVKPANTRRPCAGRDTRLRSVGNDEREQTLNQLLTELDGFESGGAAAPVICIAATNRPDVRDPGLSLCIACHCE